MAIPGHRQSLRLRVVFRDGQRETAVQPHLACQRRGQPEHIDGLTRRRIPEGADVLTVVEDIDILTTQLDGIGVILRQDLLVEKLDPRDQGPRTFDHQEEAVGHIGAEHVCHRTRGVGRGAHRAVRTVVHEPGDLETEQRSWVDQPIRYTPAGRPVVVDHVGSALDVHRHGLPGSEGGPRTQQKPPRVA
ncbi:hypothetical protein ASD42_19970 [Nocardia sp. Root136]|nr:hypothetical protein ASD42_19970 [Nocardia sp. Root136]